MQGQIGTVEVAGLQVRLGIITIRIPSRFGFGHQAMAGSVKRRTREAVNQRIIAKAQAEGRQVHFLPREDGKLALRADSGIQLEGVRKRLLPSIAIEHAINLGNFYGMRLSTTEKEGREIKVEIRQLSGEKPPNKVGVMSDDELDALLVRRIEAPDYVSCRGIWLNGGRDGLWANVIIGPAQAETERLEDIVFVFDEKIGQVVVQIPDKYIPRGAEL